MANLYAAPSLSTMKVSTFKGADHSVPEDQQKPYRAAASENMMPGAVGEVCKRPGVQVDTINRMAGTITTLKKGTVVEATVVKVVGNFFVIRYRETEESYFRVYVLRNGEVMFIAKALTKIPAMEQYNDSHLCFIDEAERSVVFVETADGVVGYEYTHVDGTETWQIMTKTDLGNTWTSSTMTPSDTKGLTIPKLMQGCRPSGGGNPLEAVNMLCPYVTESFCCRSTYGASVFYLNCQAIEGGGTDRLGYTGIFDKFHVEVLCEVTEDGAESVLRWVTRPLADGDAYRCSENRLYLDPKNNSDKNCYYMLDGEPVPVNIGTGVDGDGNATNCIGATPVEGEDNVRITHIRADAGETFRKICGATCATKYGVGGYKDRLVLGGIGSSIYYSELEDPLYIADINYITAEDAKILAVDGTADSLAILTDKGVYFSAASAIDTAENAGYVRDAALTISNVIPAPVPLNGGSVSVLGGELVYLSAEGVIAVASKENYSDRYAEHRSAMIDRELLEDDPQELISLGRFLMIRCADGVWWLLDENQPNSEGDKPYASHQYEGWRLTKMPCDAAWAEDGVLKLILGGSQYYWTAGTEADHYHDAYNGTDTPIVAWWEVPWIYGANFHRKKIFMKLGILLGQLDGADTCVKIEGKKNEEDWFLLFGYDGELCTFGYDKFDYRLFTYSGVAGDPDMARKIKVKKAMRFKLRFTNEFINQPLILREYGLDYVQEN